MNRDWSSRAARGIVAVLMLLLLDAAEAEPPRGSSYDVGVPYLIPLGAVELDERQLEAIASVRRELHDRYCTLAGELLLAQEELRAQVARRPPRTEAVAAASRRVDDIRDRIVQAWGEAEMRALELLTPQQRLVLAKWQKGRRAPLGGIENIPYTVLPGIQRDEPDIENLKDPELKPQY